MGEVGSETSLSLIYDLYKANFKTRNSNNSNFCPFRALTLENGLKDAEINVTKYVFSHEAGGEFR